MYTFRTMLQEMNTGRPFTCRFITYDQARKRGGDVRTVQAQILEPPNTKARPFTPAEASERKTKLLPRHARRVALLVDGHPTEQIRTLHIPLIIEFNGKPVVP